MATDSLDNSIISMLDFINLNISLKKICLVLRHTHHSIDG